METEGATAGSIGMRVPTGSCVVLVLFLIERVENVIFYNLAFLEGLQQTVLILVLLLYPTRMMSRILHQKNLVVLTVKYKYVLDFCKAFDSTHLSWH